MSSPNIYPYRLGYQCGNYLKCGTNYPECLGLLQRRTDADLIMTMNFISKPKTTILCPAKNYPRES